MNKNKAIPEVLLINDIHVSKDNISEFLLNFQEALSICKRENIHQICIGGDLWQSRSSQSLSTLMAVRKVFLQAANDKIDIDIAEGNHCKVDQEQFEGYSHTFDGYSNVFCIDDFSIIYENTEVCLVAMSYFPEQGSFVEKLKECIDYLTNEYPEHDWYLYIHQGINGGLSQPNEKDLPAKIFTDFQKVFVGHYHDRKIVPGTNIEYIGASRQHNFGEDEEKGYTIFYSNGDTKFIKNQVNKRFASFTINSNELDDELLAQIKTMKSNPLYSVKVKVLCSSAEAKTLDKEKLKEAGVSKIDVVTEDMVVDNETAETLDSKFDKHGICKEYKVFCENKNIINPELGLSYLDKIN